MPIEKKPVTRDDIERFRAAAEAKGQKEQSERYPNIESPFQLDVTYGKVRAKIIDVSRGSRSAWAFIDYATGDILKAASWAAPAKHARGNINTPTDGVEFVDLYGPAYLK